MLAPIRCISCGRLIADKWEDYDTRVKAGENAKDVLDDLGVESYCCRSVFLTTVDLQDKIAIYKNRTVPRPADAPGTDRPEDVAPVDHVAPEAVSEEEEVLEDEE